MEQKLKEFKKRRRREILLSKPRNFLRGIMDKISTKKDVPINIESEIRGPLLPDKPPPDTSWMLVDDDDADDEYIFPSMSFDDEVTFTFSSLSWITVLTYSLYFALWVVTCLIAVQLEIGFIYLIGSGLLFVCFNTRTGPKKEGEISAYSVFNPGCEAIDGTLKAEHLEREFNLIQYNSGL